jgi:hypothetical protein
MLLTIINVCGPLQTYLKKNQGFKLGLHERDFEAGKYNADNIIDAINTSRKIIFVISSSFLRSKWGKYELDMARMHMFQQNREIKVITKLPNSEQSYKGKVQTHNYINRQNQSTTGKL